jgi:hypothetical protein
MLICVSYEFRENAVGYYRVDVYLGDKLIRSYNVENVKLNNKLLPPTKDICVNANVLEYDEKTKWLEISDTEGVVR